MNREKKQDITVICLNRIGNSLAAEATNSENQERAGKAVAGAATDPNAQAKFGNSIAQNSSNPFVKVST